MAVEAGEVPYKNPLRQLDALELLATVLARFETLSTDPHRHSETRVTSQTAPLTIYQVLQNQGEVTHQQVHRTRRSFRTHEVESTFPKHFLATVA